jgi:hypothetical protein
MDGGQTRGDFALAFDSAMSFADMLDRLNALGPWSWRERDSAWYGNLASARAASLRLDLLESGPNEIGGWVAAGNGRQFSISVRGRPGLALSAHEWAAIERRVADEILPALGAVSVEPTDPID